LKKFHDLAQTILKIQRESLLVALEKGFKNRKSWRKKAMIRIFQGKRLFLPNPELPKIIFGIYFPKAVIRIK